jgi:hypothetical protein
MLNFKKLVARLFPDRLPSNLQSRWLLLELLEDRAVPATLVWIGGTGTTPDQQRDWGRGQLEGGSDDEQSRRRDARRGSALGSCPDGA